MSLIQRFTRDSASKYVWSLMALAAVIGLVYAVTRGWEAVEAERVVSQERALEYVDRVIEPRVEASDVGPPLVGEALEGIEAAVRRSILVDERVARVRIWSTGGVLLSSTDPADRPGSRAGLNDAVVREASRDGVLTRTGLSDTGGDDDPERDFLRTYVPLPGDAVVEIDQTAAGTLGPVRQEWFSYQLLAAGAAALFLILTALSLRDPIERINVGVPFAATSVPAGYSLIDNDRLDAVEEVYRLGSERVARLKRKLADSEEARRRLEGHIQRTLTKAATGAPTPRTSELPAAVEAPADEATADEAPVAEPAPVQTEDTPVPVAPVASPPTDVVEVPDSEIVSASPAAARKAGPLARAARDQKPPPDGSRRKKPSAPKARKPPAPKAKKAPKKTQQQQRAAPEPPAPQPVATPVPAPSPAREVAAVGAKAAARARSPVADTEASDAEAHEAALETFIRLTESDRQQHEGSEVDQGAVRAALARTAARKKPGGERLHRPEPDRSTERPGGPPPDQRG